MKKGFLMTIVAIVAAAVGVVVTVMALLNRNHEEEDEFYIDEIEYLDDDGVEESSFDEFLDETDDADLMMDSEEADDTTTEAE